MAILTKAQLQADNSASFADNNTQAITPLILRSYNGNIIDTLVDSLDTGSFARTAVSNDFTAANSFTSISASSFISASAFVGDGTKITGVTASVSLPISEEGVLLGNSTQLNFSGSNITAVLNAGIATISVTVNNLVTTSSFNTFTASTNTFTASQVTKDTTLQTYTASVDTKFTAVGVSTASLNSFTSSQTTKDSTLATYTGSVNTSLSALNQFTASQSTASIVTSLTELNSFTSSQNTKNSTLAIYTASIDTKFTAVGSSTASLNAFTASFTFNTASFVTTSSFQSYTSSTDTKFVAVGSSTSSLNTATASLFTSASLSLTTASVNVNIITFRKGDGTTFDITVAASGSVIPGTITGSAQITALGFVSSSVTASSLVTASVSLNTITFTKGDASTFNIIVNTGSAQTTDITSLNSFTSSQYVSNSYFATTGSNTFVGNQTITGNITAFSASFTYLQTTFESSSVIYSSGSNIFGDELSDTQTLSGSVKVQGSLTVNGTPVQTSSVSITALNSFTASQYVSNSFFATTGSNTFIGNQIITGDLLVSGSNPIDVNVVGRVSITGPTSGETPRLFISSSDASAELGRSFVSIDSTNAASLNSFIFVTSNVAKQSDNFVAVNNGDFSVDVELNMFANSSSIGFADWDNGVAFAYVPFMTLTPNLGNNPAPLMTRGLQVTGSTQIQNFTASLQQGYVYVGNSSGITTTVATSSFGTTINTGSFATTGSNAFFGTNTFSGSVSFTGSAPTILSQSFSGSIITNLTDTYTDVAAVNQIVTLTSASYAALASGSLTNPNTLYIVSGSTSGSITGATLGSNTFSGSQIFTGSVQGNVVSMSITSNTASMNLSLGNYFTLTLADTATTHISASNVQPGVSATLVITTGTNSSASLAPTMLQPSGSAYSATNGSGKKDVLSIVAVASGVPFVVSTKNMI